MPLMPVIGKQRQVSLCKFEASLVYINEFQDSQSYVVRPCLKKKKMLSSTTNKI